MSDIHAFRVEVAEKVGVNAAIILRNIEFWTKTNIANDANFHDGRYWTYNSVKAFAGLYPYMGKGAVERALRKLEEEGYIVTGNYNKVAYDRTKWYALTDAGLRVCEMYDSISRKQEMDYRNSGNQSREIVEPIPDVTPCNPSSNHVRNRYETKKPAGSYQALAFNGDDFGGARSERSGEFRSVADLAAEVMSMGIGGIA